MKKKVIVVGGGVAGMQAATTLTQLGIEPLIIEKTDSLGGKVTGWSQLFPSFTPAHEVVDALRKQVADAGIEVRYNTSVERVLGDGVELAGGEKVASDAVVLCSGFDLFDATLKEEYGYGIYDNVFTSVDIERMFNEGKVATAQGEAPKKIAILHCVGSRDEKVGQRHCSRVCCVMGVKQAMELKRMFPDSEIFNFYMDIRMFGPGYEELYRQAQIENNIHFVRGRISEASPAMDNRIQIKAEDTLVGRPLKMTVDMLVLLVGMCGAETNQKYAENGDIKLYPSGFVKPVDQFTSNCQSDAANIFYAGAITAPKNIGESINEGVTAAHKVAEYLKA